MSYIIHANNLLKIIYVIYALNKIKLISLLTRASLQTSKRSDKQISLRSYIKCTFNKSNIYRHTYKYSGMQ